MQDEFAGLFEQGQTDLPPEHKEGPSGRDSKRHLPKEKKYGRQYDRKSAAGERRFPAKQGRGKGNWGDKRDTRPVREETPEQKARREEFERQQQEMLDKHEEYLKTIEKANMEVQVQLQDEKVEKADKVSEDIKKFSKQEKQQHKGERKQTKTTIEVF